VILAAFTDNDDALGFAIWRAQTNSTGILPGPILLRFTTLEFVTVVWPEPLTFPPQTELRQMKHEYELAGRLELRPVVIDPCAGFLTAVQRAKASVDDARAQISSLQEQLQDTSDKPAILEEIRRVRTEELGPAQQALQAAQAALDQCRG